MFSEAQLRFSSSELTDAGKQQQQNEDATLSIPQRGIFCVADGMGGISDDKTASVMALQILAKKIGFSDTDLPLEETTRTASRALEEASFWIKERSDERGGPPMATTVAVLILDCLCPGRGIILHAGDSRVYRSRSGILEQLTTDHSIAAVAGVADEDDLPPMLRGVMTNAVGTKEEVHIEKTPIDVASDDTFLLCTDGLSRVLSMDVLSQKLDKYRSETLEKRAQLLAKAANSAGGDDDVSVILVHIDRCSVPGSDGRQSDEPLTDMSSSVRTDAAIGFPPGFPRNSSETKEDESKPHKE